MSRVRIHNNHFVKDGKPFFYQGDTLWMAFSKMSCQEWREVMQIRRAQRFTVAQISVLPISHDNAPAPSDLQPFAVVDGHYDFDRINDAYFDKAEALLAETVGQDIVPCLHLMWANYVPDTWAAQRCPDTVMTWEQAERYLRYALARFEKYEPIYSVSGDTAFETERVVDTYANAIALIRSLSPEALLTLHLSPRSDPPARLELDFYTYQSGHMLQEQDQCFTIPAQFLARGDGKPVVNTEPAYEAHGHGFGYGRYTAFDIRRALWQSLLSGASAGIGYGAHGMWMMYRENQEFNGIQFSGKPYGWRMAIELDGAWEGAFAQQLYERYDLFGMQPLDCLKGMPPQVRAARAANGTVLIYAPYGCDVSTNLNVRDYRFDAFEMEHKRYMKPTHLRPDGEATICMPQCNTDVLHILTPQ